MKQPIRLFITDLDNTLYNWISAFVPAFYGMVEAACKILEVEPPCLLDELKAVHQRYRNSEQPFALLETPAVERRFPQTTLLQKKLRLKDAFNAFERIRADKLRAYPGVHETLQSIRSSGCPILGYTEAVPENSLFRLVLLGLADDLDFLYAPRSRYGSHPDPNHPRKLDSYQKRLRFLPAEHRKPDPSVLADICAAAGREPDEVLYLGDSLLRDVAMAKSAGVHPGWARYGNDYDPEDWRRLARITHWTHEDINREQELQLKYGNIQPEVAIDAFAQLLEYFIFASSG
jgi:phosphoglycolate phosphatase-like HAD superfamily hydrolase